MGKPHLPSSTSGVTTRSTAPVDATPTTPEYTPIVPRSTIESSSDATARPLNEDRTPHRGPYVYIPPSTQAYPYRSQPSTQHLIGGKSTSSPATASTTQRGDALSIASSHQPQVQHSDTRSGRTDPSYLPNRSQPPADESLYKTSDQHFRSDDNSFPPWAGQTVGGSRLATPISSVESKRAWDATPGPPTKRFRRPKVVVMTAPVRPKRWSSSSSSLSLSEEEDSGPPPPKRRRGQALAQREETPSRGGKEFPRLDRRRRAPNRR